MAEEEILERSADFEERVKTGGPFKTEEFALMTDEEFALVLPVLGSTQEQEAILTRQRSMAKRRGSGPAIECN